MVLTMSGRSMVVLCLKMEMISQAYIMVNCLKHYEFVIFKPLSHCFEETIGFGVKASFISRPTSRLIS